MLWLRHMLAHAPNRTHHEVKAATIARRRAILYDPAVVADREGRAAAQRGATACSWRVEDLTWKSSKNLGFVSLSRAKKCAQLAVERGGVVVQKQTGSNCDGPLVHGVQACGSGGMCM